MDIVVRYSEIKGVILSKMPLSELLVDVSRGRRTFSRFEENPGSQDDETGVFLGGDSTTGSILLDISGTTLPSEFDLLDQIASDNNVWVVGFTFRLAPQTISFVATRGDKRRCLIDRTSMKRPFSYGESFASEAKLRLDAEDGSGINAALESIGFASIPFGADWTIRNAVWLTWPSALDLTREGLLSEPGELRNELVKHNKKYMESLDVKVRVRKLED